MKKEKKINYLLKKILIWSVFIYVLYIFIGQQKTLNTYKKSQAYYSNQISTQLAYQESLLQTKSNIGSKEYIEKVAREKLDMYLPNERVYIDKGN